ncbi:ATP-dependent DNA helicase RecG [Deinococcus piscis]|uniref:ATP-dependent DNA helicase RecG n=1 Tax=Deinococcus piscis TaxID=394230 RepID=A0ABQ3JZY4_9DEIO|nr:ATP-dependent DNA helicase RecG [Deinococcus piscis]
MSPLGAVPPPGPECIHLSAAVLPDELARYAIGLANARGGTILVGAGEDDGVQDLHPLMLTHAIFELSGGRLSVNVQSHRQPGGREVLSVFVPRAPYVLSDPGGAVLAWNGQHLVPVSQTEAEPVADVDYTATIPPDASLADLDTAEVGRLRLFAERSGGQRAAPIAGLPDIDFLRELGLLSPSGGALRPNLAAILLAGTPAAIRAHIPQAEVCFYHHQTLDVEFHFREDLVRPIPATLSRLAELIQARNRFTPVQVGLFRIEVWEQDETVYREALLNALTHRDYQSRDAVHVHLYPNRLDILNPGGLPGGITPGNILRHQPKRRNPLLAEVLARLGLIEQAGVGVDKMFGLMLRHGKEPPEFTTYPDAVELSLHSMGFDAEFVRFVARKQEELQTLSLDMLIVLSVLAREGEATRAALARALQLAEDRTPRLLRQMEDIGLIERAGVGRGIAYLLGAEAREALQRANLRQAMQAPVAAPVPAPAAALAERGAPNFWAGGWGKSVPTTALQSQQVPAVSAAAAPHQPIPEQPFPSQPVPSQPAPSTAAPAAQPPHPDLTDLPAAEAAHLHGPSRAEIRAIALALARERGSVCNADLREACGLTQPQAWRVLRGLVQSGHLARTGGGRSAAYQLPRRGE